MWISLSSLCWWRLTLNLKRVFISPAVFLGATNLYESWILRDWGCQECFKNRKMKLRFFFHQQHVSHFHLHRIISDVCLWCFAVLVWHVCVINTKIYFFLIAVKCIKSKPAFFAERLYKSMKVIILYLSYCLNDFIFVMLHPQAVIRPLGVYVAHKLVHNFKSRKKLIHGFLFFL